MTGTVSVVIPTYNCAERLMQALASVAMQTFPHDHLEVLVIDDGSTDDTSDRVTEFASRNNFPLRYVRQDNGGPAAARNHGIRLSRGSLIAFLDDDDRWLPAKLERQATLFHDAIGLVYCDNTFVDAAGALLPDYVRKINLVRGDVRLALFLDFFILTSAVCLRKSIIDEVGYFDERLQVGEDYEFFLRVATRCQFDFVAEKLLERTVRSDSLSRRDYALDFSSDLATLRSYLEACPEFATRNRSAVRKRLADYQFEFGYSLLSHGRRREACRQLAGSLWQRPSVRAAKTFARMLLPTGT